MSTQIVAQVRDALFAKELRPGDFLGTEKDLAGALRRQPHRRARCAAHARGAGHRRHQGRVRRRRAHRAGQCPPVRRGAGGAARSRRRLGRRDHGCAARHRVPRGRTRRRQLHRRGPRAAARAHRRCRSARSTTSRAYTRSSREFHLAVAEASHNRVLVVQLISLQHVSWPARNPTLTPKVARRILDVHKELAVAHRNARRRRRAPADGRPREDDRAPGASPSNATSAQRSETAAERNATHREPTTRERSTDMAKDKFIIEPHFRLQEWVAEEKGYFKDEGLDYVFQELVKSTDGAHHYKGDKVGAMQSFERGRTLGRELRLPLDRRRRRLEGQRQALRRRLFGLAVRRLRARGLAGQAARGSRRRADLGRLPVGQPLLDHPGARAVHAGRQDQSDLRRRHAVPPPRPAARRQGAGLDAVQRPLLLRRAARLPQDHRHHLHDRDHDHRRSRSGGPAQVLPRAAGARSATSICGPSSTRTTTRTNSRCAITP